MTKIISDIENIPIAHTLSELTVWPIRQGEDPHFLPLSIDVRFLEEEVRTKKHVLSVHLKRAYLDIQLSNASIVRGSHFGSEVHEPYVVAEITETVRKTVQDEEVSNYSGEIRITQVFSGIFAAVFSRRRTKRKSVEGDSTVRMSQKISRVTYRGWNKWTFCEPIDPYLLSGQYIGMQVEWEGKIRESPICALMLDHAHAEAVMNLTAQAQDISVKSKGVAYGRNREAIISVILSRSLSQGSLFPGVTPNSGDLLLNHSRIRVRNED